MHLGNSPTKLSEPEKLSGSGMGSGCGGEEQCPAVDAVLETRPGAAAESRRNNRAQSVHEVFDLINCGPRRRFAVRAGANSPVLIAHNCTQAVARDVFAHNLLLVEDACHRTLFTVHDEDVPEIPQDADATTITKLMSTTPPWIPGLPVGAETKETNRYLK